MMHFAHMIPLHHHREQDVYEAFRRKRQWSAVCSLYIALDTRRFQKAPVCQER